MKAFLTTFLVSTALLNSVMFTAARAEASYQTYQEAFDAGVDKSRSDEDYVASREAFEVALELATTEPQRSDAQMFIALCYFNEKDYPNAKEAGAKVIEVAPAGSPALSGTQLMLARIALAEDRDPHAAIPLLEEVIAETPNAHHRCEAHLFFGFALKELGETEKAKAEFKACVESPDGPSATKLRAEKELEKLGP